MEAFPLERSHVVGMEMTAKLVPQRRREVVVDDSGKHLVGCPSKTKRKPEKATSNKSESSTKVLKSDTKNKVNTNESKKKHKIENSFKYPAVSLVDPKAKGKQGKGTAKTGSTQQTKSAVKKQQTKKVKFDNTEVISSRNLENSSTKGPLLLLKKQYEYANLFAPGYLQSSSVQDECPVGSDAVLDKVEKKVRHFDKDTADDNEVKEVETETETCHFGSSCVVDTAQQEVEAETKAIHFVSDCVADKGEQEVVTDVYKRENKSESERKNEAESENESKPESKERYFCSDPAADEAEHEDKTEYEASERPKGVASCTAETDVIGKDGTAKKPTTATENVEGKVCRLHYDVDASFQENNQKDDSFTGGNKVILELSSLPLPAVHRDLETSAGEVTPVQIKQASGQMSKTGLLKNVQIMDAVCASTINYTANGLTSDTGCCVSSTLICATDNETSTGKYFIVPADGAGVDSFAAYGKNCNSVDCGSSDCVALVANGSAADKSIQSTIVGASCNIVSDTQPAEIGNLHHRGEGESCVVVAGRRYSSDEGYAEDQSQNVSVDCENELCQFRNPNELINCENKMCGENESQDVASECRKELLGDYDYEKKLPDYETEPSSENQSQNVSDYYENKGTCGEQIHNLAYHFEGEDCSQNAITYCNATNQNLPLHSFHVTKNIDYLPKGGNILFQEDPNVIKTTDDTQNRNGANEVIKADKDLIASRYAKPSRSSYNAVSTRAEGDAVRPKKKDEPITVNDKLIKGLSSADNISTEAEFKVKENDVSVSKNKKFEICEDQPVFCAMSDCADVNMNTQFLPEGAVKDSFYNCVYYPFGLINIPQQPENTRPCEVILKRLSSWDVQKKNDLENRLVTLYRLLHERTRNGHMTSDIQEEIRKCEDQYEDFLNEYLDFPSR